MDITGLKQEQFDGDDNIVDVPQRGYIANVPDPDEIVDVPDLIDLKSLLKSKPHRCELCSKCFQTKRLLRNHNYVHTNERPFKCTKCNKNYKQISMLRYHQDTHLQTEDRNKRKFVCQICNVLFTARSSLRRHFKRVHKQQNDKPIAEILAKISDEVYNCELCSIQFYSNDLYLSHVRNHHLDQIDVEDKHSTNANVPELDEIVDVPDLDEIVDVPDLIDLKSLLKSKPHRCELCSKCFQTKRMLRDHTYVHTNERPFKCTKCNKTYKQVSMLRYHEDTHLQAEDRNKRKFVCQICNVLFTARSSLRRHFKRVHKLQNDKSIVEIVAEISEKVYNCEPCSKQFYSNDLYLSHVGNHHLDQIDVEDKHSTNADVPSIDEIAVFDRKMHVEEKHSPNYKIPDQVDLKNNEPATTSPIKIVSTCSKCLKEFSNADQLEIHNIIHTNEKYCPFCKKQFARRYDFIVHAKTHLKSELHTCKWCSKNFQSKRNLRVHTYVHTKERPYKCTKCNKSYNQVSTLRYHENTHLQAEDRNKRKFVCQICNVLFTTRSSLDRHLKRIHNRKNDKPITQIFDETSEKPYNCKLCSMQLSCNDLYLNHVREHHSDQIFECTYCKKQYISQLALKMHVEDKHSPKCHDCNELFASPGDYSNHVKQCHQTCNQCHISFCKNSDYKYHMTTHSDWHIQCKVCQKKFFNKRGHDIHMMRIHSTELQFKSFKCDQCDKAFKSHSLVRKHRLLHKRNIKQFACTSCTWSFDTAESLKLHTICHMKQGEIICDVCRKSFSDVRNLRKHYLKFHKSKTKNDSSSTAAAPEDFVPNNDEQATSNDELQTLVKSECPEVCVKVEEYEEIDIKIEKLY